MCAARHNGGTQLTEKMLDTVGEAISAIAAGKMVIVVDDTDREDEGNLIVAARYATSQNIGFMIRHTSGIICTSMSAERADELRFDPMVGRNSDPMGTAFTVSVDYLSGLSTGISAKERAATVRAIANQNAQAGDFSAPGYVFPLVAKRGGVLVRSGHTEAGVDLAHLAGLEPVAAIAEVVDESGEPMRLPQLLVFAKEHDLRIISIEDLIAYRMQRDKLVTCVSKRTVMVRQQQDRSSPGSIGSSRSEMSSRRTGSTRPFTIQAKGEGRGLMLLLHDPPVEGEAQAQAATHLASEDHQSASSRRQRRREVGIGAQILRDLGMNSITLLDSGKRNYVAIGGFGIVRQLV
jgi:3,4-dihydroxy 2-butanone 4-phosphate synthase/GTP cyclohydrolase II